MADEIKVYISYAHEDYEIAKRLYDDLKDLPNVKPWLDDEDIIPGQKRKPAITKVSQILCCGRGIKCMSLVELH